MNIPAKILIAGTFGIVAHILGKVQQINKDLKPVDFRDVFRAFFRYDWPMVLISFVVISFSAFASDELITTTDKYADHVPNSILGILSSRISAYIKVEAFLLGLVADWVLGLVISVTKKRLLQKFTDAGLKPEEIVNLPQRSEMRAA